LEDRNPVPHGDKRFVQLNLTTLEKAGEEPVTPEAPAVQPPDENAVAIAAKISHREKFRYTNAAKIHDGDRQGFIKWMADFFIQHEIYCMDKVKDLPMSVDVITSRLSDTRLLMLECYDELMEYPTERINDEITNLIMDGLYGNQSKRLSN